MCVLSSQPVATAGTSLGIHWRIAHRHKSWTCRLQQSAAGSSSNSAGSVDLSLGISEADGNSLRWNLFRCRHSIDACHAWASDDGRGVRTAVWLLAAVEDHSAGSGERGCQSPDDTTAGSSGNSLPPLALKQTAQSIRICIAMGLPLIAGFIVLAVMNHHITGSWTKSAYQLYTDTWTPRHRFGFNNVVIGEKLAGPKVLNAYDRWATNLTPDVAATNLRNRVVAESQWTLGVVSLLFLMIIAVPMSLRMKSVRSSSTSESSAVQFDCRLMLIMLSIVSLYLVHVPYWYDGILHWHYVFESAPLVLIVATLGLRSAYESLKPLLSARWAALWLTMLVLSGLLPNWLTAETLWGTSRVSAAVSEQSFSRVRFEQFRMLTSMPSVQKPCLILVDENSSDPQLSFIVNPPDLKGDVLTCRKPQDAPTIQDLRTAFPDRTLYEFQPQTFELKRVP